MLKKIVDVIHSSKFRVEGYTLYCDNHVLSDLEYLNFFEENSILENTIIDPKIGEIINLELSLTHLNSQGYYEDINSFIKKNKYEEPNTNYFIDEIKCYKGDSNINIEKYKSILELIKSIKSISKHTYDDLGIQYSLITIEEKAILLNFDYNEHAINSIHQSSIDNIDFICSIFNEKTNEKKLLFINELINFLSKEIEENRFNHLLTNFIYFYNQCINSYQFYLRDFSYNKLKLELDSKALEFTQKIQSVINDAQVKLIAIPTAFVLVVGTFDFSDLSSIKNIVSIINLFIFSILIQLFINNQKSTLNFIWQNILTYKESFKGNNIESISSKFSLVEDELKIQKGRILIVEIILWLIPISLLLFLIWNWKVNLAIYCVFILIIVIDYIITNFD